MRTVFFSDSMPQFPRHFRKPMITTAWALVLLSLLLFSMRFYLTPTDSSEVIAIFNEKYNPSNFKIKPKESKINSNELESTIPITITLNRPAMNEEEIRRKKGLEKNLTKIQVANGHLKIPQDDSRLLQYIKDHHLIPPPTNGTPDFTSSIPNINYTEQQEVFRYVIGVLGNKTRGFFIECGANDGEYYSNTVGLERDYQWTGLLVEPDPRPLPRLIKRGRNAWIVNVCLSTDNSPKEIKMMGHKEELLSFVPGFRHFGSTHGFTEFKAQCFPLFSILKAINVTTIDYFSLDIEGAELAVLKTIPWDSVFIKVLSIEVHPSYVSSVRDYMTSIGYQYLTFIQNTYSHDQIYIHGNATRII